MEATQPIRPSDPPTSTLPGPSKGRARRWCAIVGIGLFLAVLYGPGLAAHVARSADPYRFNDDPRQQIWPFLRYHDPTLFRRDVAADYFLACYPVGFKAIYASASHVVDPRTL